VWFEETSNLYEIEWLLKGLFSVDASLIEMLTQANNAYV
jgi:hypothetical protein